MTGGSNYLSISWMTLSFAGLVAMGSIAVGLLAWCTWWDGPDMARSWALLVSAPTAAWLVLHGQAVREARRHATDERLERLAEVMSMDPGR